MNPSIMKATMHAICCLLIILSYSVLSTPLSLNPPSINITAIKVFHTLSPSPPDLTPVNSSHGLIVDFSPPPDCSNVCLIVDDNGVAGCMPYEATVVEGEGTSRLIVSYEDKVSSENYNPSYVTVVCGSSDFTQPTSSLTATSRPTPTLTHSDRLTIVLTLTLKDFSRATLLLTTLNKYTRSVPFSELIVVVPNSQQSVFEVVLFDLPYSKFSIRVVGEEELFEGGFNQSWNKYALQMAIKLKVSKIVNTEFYVTLDADVLVANNLVVSDFVDNDRRGNYVQEARSVHPRWWEGSKRILKIEEEHSDLDDPTNGIGVTPAVMSTAGSMLVLGRMKQIHTLQLYEENWLSSFDTVWWSEYTMYRLTLNFFGVFEHLHSAFEGVKLSCFNVWWEGDLPWDPEPLFGRSGAAAQVCDDEVKDEVKDKCLFTVLQSTSGIEPSDIAKQLYDLKVI